MNELMNQKLAAALLGVTPRRLRQIDNEASPPPKVGGQYPAGPFGKWMEARTLKRLSVTDDGKVLDPQQEQARLAHHRANNEALKERQTSGELIPAEAVLLGWHDHVFAVRARLLALPTKIAPEVLHLSTLREIESAARELVYEALDELAGLGGMPPGFFERIEKLQTEIPDFPARILAALEQCSNG